MATTPKTFCVSDETINDYGFRLLTDGIDTTAFEANPVMLFMHRRGKVFGKWSNLTKQDGRLLATEDFDREDTDKEVQDVIGKVDRGYLNASSLGVTPNEMLWNEALNCYDCVRSTLVEISVVDVGSNRNALVLYSPTREVLTDVQLASQLAEAHPDLTTTTKTTMLKLTMLALATGLAETATEDELSARIVQLKGNDDYKAKYDALIADQKKEKVNLAAKLIDDAIADKRIGADMKESYSAMFELSYDHAAKILSGLSKPVDLVEMAKQGGAGASAAAASETWDILHKAGKLEALQLSHPEQFKMLYKAEYGVDYKE